MKHLIKVILINLLFSGVAFGDVFYFHTSIISATLNEAKNRFEVIYRQPNTICVQTGFSNTPCPDSVWMMVYGVRDGKITFIKEIEGRHIPKKTIPEEFIFDETKE